MKKHLICFAVLWLLTAVSCTTTQPTQTVPVQAIPTVAATLTLPTTTEIELATAAPAHTPIPHQVDTATAVLPTFTPNPPTVTNIPAPSPTPLPLLNNLTADDILVMPTGAVENARQIYANGQQWGRDDSRFSVLGDSTVLNPHLLARFGDEDLVLGEYVYLDTAVHHFASSWPRYGVAARNGLHSWSVFDPLWADKDWCQANEDLLSCEFRLNNPAFLLVRLGSNDAGSPTGFEFNVKEVIEHTIASGIIPIIITKPDRFEGDNTNNEFLRRLAAEYSVPLWDLDRVAETLPGKGLREDQVHMKEYVENDFTNPAIFENGHAMQDLSGLMALHTLWQIVRPPED